jgi:hypothetical protein
MCLLLFVACVSASVGGGQPGDDKKPESPPEKPRPSYTAFPDLKPPTIERKQVINPDGTPQTVLVEKDAVPLPPWPTMAAGAPQLRKLQFEQLQEGREYLERIKKVLQIGAYNAQFFRDYIDMTAEVYRLAAELEEQPARRIPWYEARVRKLKEFEHFAEIRYRESHDPPQAVNLARFSRLRAEIELTKLKTEVEKAGGK